jgi:uncharacterized membrane protein (GlpM family)
MAGQGPGGSSAPDHEAHDEDRPALRFGKLRELSVKELAIRFAFGAGVSLLAAAISTFGGPLLGGVFLAFPAILLASLTLVAKEEGLRRARDDARGAAIGTIGLISFAAVALWSLAQWPPAAALAAATGTWAGVSGAVYLVASAFGAGGDERRPSA